MSHGPELGVYLVGRETNLELTEDLGERCLVGRFEAHGAAQKQQPLFGWLLDTECGNRSFHVW
jgi:hypothetical protein